ncbi:MAG: CDGSH iron-sulfur domain-containing protein [Burkholderiales bacterium]
MSTSSPIYRYAGEAVDVTWDQRLCIHIGECGGAKGELFVTGREPWCRPDVTSVAEVAEVCERCPSGALVYEAKDGAVTEQPAACNTVHVTYRGPLFVRGDLGIEGGPADMPGTRFRAALCRCGASKNKPFCDNSHVAAGFDDAGAVGEAGSRTTAGGGPLVIRGIRNGPLHLTGNLSIQAGSGVTRWHGTEAFLCRCGASKNKPFCDGTHKRIGFTAG